MTWLHLAVFAGYLAVAVVLWWRVWVTGHPSGSISCPCGDPSEEIWWLRWLPWALLHGHNPFFTHAMNVGMGGVNGLANTSWYLPALVAAPVTLLFGPIAAFNVLATVIPAFSAWCMFVLCRRLTTFVPGQVLAGLLWGFSPFVVTNLPYGHLHMVTGFFAPLAALVCVNLVMGRRPRRAGAAQGTRIPPDGPNGLDGPDGGPPLAEGPTPVRYERSPILLGLALAGLVIGQFFVSTEYLLDAMLIAGVASVTAAAVAWPTLWRARHRILVGGATALGVSIAVLAYPTWYAVAGPEHVTGQIWPDNGLGLALNGVVSPGSFVHTKGVFLATLGNYGPGGPDFAYLGIPLLVFLAVSAVRWYRRPLAWVLVVSGVVAWVCCLGQPVTGPRWPWGYLDRLPGLDQVQPQRFSAFVMFSAAGLLAVSLDGWWPVVRRIGSGPAASAARRTATVDPSIPGSTGKVAVGSAVEGIREPAPLRTRQRRAGRVAAVILAVVGGLLLVPIAATYSVLVVHPEATPSWYATVAPRLPQGTNILSIPDPVEVPTNAMVWQAEDGFRYNIVGGYAVYPGQDGHSDAWRSRFTGTPAILQQLSLGVAGLPSVANSQTAEVRGVLHRWGVDVVVVSAPTLSPTLAAAYLTAVMGRLPVYEHDAWVWYGLGTSPARELSAPVLQRCAMSAATSKDPMTGPGCVMASATAP